MSGAEPNGNAAFANLMGFVSQKLNPQASKATVKRGTGRGRGRGARGGKQAAGSTLGRQAASSGSFYDGDPAARPGAEHAELEGGDAEGTSWHYADSSDGQTVAPDRDSDSDASSASQSSSREASDSDQEEGQGGSSSSGGEEEGDGDLGTLGSAGFPLMLGENLSGGGGAPLDVEIDMGHLEYLMQMFSDMDADVEGQQEGPTAQGDAPAPAPSQGTTATQRADAVEQLPAGAAPAGQGGQGEHDGDAFVELRPGEPLPPGRLGALYSALAANRALAAHLREVVMPRIDRALDVNWNHSKDIRAAPELASAARKEERARRHRTAADPLKAGAGQRKVPGMSRVWVIDGQAPEPSRDAQALAQELGSLPSSYERTRWSSRLVERLRKGVEAEVHAHLSAKVLEEMQALQRQAAEGAAAPPGPGLQDLGRRFAEIQAVKPDSEEAYRLTAAFTDEQWARISSAHVRERSGVDCKVYWLHSMRPNPAWTDAELRQLQELVAEHGTNQWLAVAAGLGTGRTPARCLSAWLRGARPEGATKGRQHWTPADTALLEQLVAIHGTRWVKISQAFGGRYDRHQLRDRWHGQAAQRNSRKLGRWTQDEDKRLKAAVEEHGQRWREVSAAVQTRTPQQCRERWCNVIAPESGPWSTEEIEALKRGVEETTKAHGRILWGKVSAYVSNRTDDQCKRAWKQLQSKGTITIREVNKSGRPPRPHARGRAPGRGRGAKRKAAARSPVSDDDTETGTVTEEESEEEGEEQEQEGEQEGEEGQEGGDALQEEPPSKRTRRGARSQTVTQPGPPHQQQQENDSAEGQAGGHVAEQGGTAVREAT